MANYRQIHTRIWKDSWFLALLPAEKLLFIYLFSNERATVAGIYELPLPVICFETGLDEAAVSASLQRFEQAGKVHYADDIIWVVNLRKYNESSSRKVHIRIESDVAAVRTGTVKTRYLAHFSREYPIRTKTNQQIPYPAITSEQDQEKENEIETEKEIERGSRPEQTLAENDRLVDAVFDAWHAYFPHKPQPHQSPALRKKVHIRLKSDHFRQSYEAALARASRCRALQRETWFRFEFLIKNDENYQKMLDGWMEWKDRQHERSAPAPPETMRVSMDEAERLNGLLAKGDL